MTDSSHASPSSSGSWVAYAAAAWALIFSALHIVWAAGYYVGLNHESARRAFQQPWFLVYDVVVAVVCAVAVIVALALVGRSERGARRWLVGVLASVGTLLLVLRGGAGAAYVLYGAASGRDVIGASAFWEIWFCLGAALFAASTWRFWRRSQGVK